MRVCDCFFLVEDVVVQLTIVRSAMVVFLSHSDE